jgi:hypothetical protein
MRAAAIALDLVRPPQRAARAVAWVLLVAVVLLAAEQARRHAAAEEAAEQLTLRRELLQLRSSGPAGASKPASANAATQARLARAAPLVAHLSLPWDGLFAAIEAADSRRLALLTLEPHARDASLRLSGEAASLAEVLAYIDRLSRQPLLDQVHLAGFESAQREGAGIVVFSVQARWMRP